MTRYNRQDYKTALPQIEKDMESIQETLGGLLDFFYPVGTIYETEDANFNPNITWGGTWEKIEGKVLVGLDSDDTYFDTVGETGGNKGSFYHTHNEAELVGNLRIRRMNHTSGNLIDADYGTDNIFSYTREGSGGTHGNSVQYNSASCKPDLITLDASHEHDAVGDSNNIDANIGNMPPYEVVVIWKRIS